MEKLSNTQIGTKIRFYRDRAKITQNELSNMLSISRSTLIRIEQGKQAVSVSDFYLFCQYVDIEPQDFFFKTFI